MKVNKQIEEMAIVISDLYDCKKTPCSNCGIRNNCHWYDAAARLYNNDYRKASDVFAEIEACMLNGAIGGKYPVKIIDLDKFDELEKKYEVTNNG